MSSQRWLVGAGAAVAVGIGIYWGYRRYTRKDHGHSMPPERLYMGLDLSTQQLKAIVINEDLQLVEQAAVRYDTDLPLYQTKDGSRRQADGVTVTSPTLMWVEALDLVLQRLKDKGCDLSRVVCVSGAGQQHGSVYWRKGARQMLKELRSDQILKSQLLQAFAVTNSPIWMDSSTTEQCRGLEEAVGGASQLAEATGSKAYERFTGTQIRKVFEKQKEAYESCERISLVSSFVCSLLVGDYAPIDYSDGSGMNLLDIRPYPREWWAPAVSWCGEDLAEKLGEPEPSDKIVGKMCKYFVDRYGFSRDCQVAAFTGDNPSSLAGFCLQPGDVVVSLGTSDTLFLWLKEPKPALVGHIFVNPVDPKAYMALLCYKNGDITRKHVRDACMSGSSSTDQQRWEEFSQLLEKSPKGNKGNIGIYFRDVEIVPFAQGEFRVDASGKNVDSFAKEVEVRALIEGQIMAKRLHAESLGYHVGPGTRVLATGGASNNPAILQIMADIFNTSVYTMDVSESACLGGAYRAKHCYVRTVTDTNPSFTDVIVRGGTTLRKAATPSPDAAGVYEPLLERYRMLEEEVARSYKPQ